MLSYCNIPKGAIVLDLYISQKHIQILALEIFSYLKERLALFLIYILFVSVCVSFSWPRGPSWSKMRDSAVYEGKKPVSCPAPCQMRRVTHKMKLGIRW